MLKQIAKGHRSVVYLTNYNGKKAIKKVEKENISAINRIQNEITWLKKLNKYDITPKFYTFGKNYFICEYITGKRIISYLENSKKPIKVIKEILKQCRILDKLHIDKKEMSNPYKHIIIRRNKPIMIDFERAKFSLKPSNVTAFFSFLTSGKILTILNKKKIDINKYELKLLLQKYKKSYFDNDFEELINNITNF